MKNVLISNGSMRKKTTYALLKKIESQFNDVQFDFVNIADYEIKPCVGCENCLRNGACTIKNADRSGMCLVP